MDDEQIVLVDTVGKPIGFAPKLASHHKDTPLHLAFSCYVFDKRGRLLVTQRAHSKKVWPGVWTNSCCGHPAPGEAVEAAVHRRVSYELGISLTDVVCILPDYTYKTPLFHGVREHEFCPVFIARTQEEPHPNPAEVAACKWLSWKAFQEAAQRDVGNEWSWWCKDQLRYLAGNKQILQYAHAHKTKS